MERLKNIRIDTSDRKKTDILFKYLQKISYISRLRWNSGHKPLDINPNRGATSYICIGDEFNIYRGNGPYVGERTYVDLIKVIQLCIILINKHNAKKDNLQDHIDI